MLRLLFAVLALFAYASPGTPRITAIGRGDLARRIVEIAQAGKVPITDKPELALALSRLEIDQEIPVELYRAVAEVPIYILRIAETAK
jgi:flagellar biosynthesis protein